MQIKRRNIPTIASVSKEMMALEFRYSITTDEFLRKGLDTHVSEDDAMRWRYLREQLSALQESAVEGLYSASPKGAEARLKNCENTSELLAA